MPSLSRTWRALNPAISATDSPQQTRGSGRLGLEDLCYGPACADAGGGGGEGGDRGEHAEDEEEEPRQGHAGLGAARLDRSVEGDAGGDAEQGPGERGQELASWLLCLLALATVAVANWFQNPMASRSSRTVPRPG
jgi:hypothetical protein